MQCDCRNPDLTQWGICQGCGDPIDLEPLRERAVQLRQPGYELEEDQRLALRPVHRRLDDPNGSIRLLRLWNSAHRSDPLFGKFEVVSMKKAPEYEAISYTWADEDGDSELRQVILIDSSVLPITNSCSAALRKLRLPDKERLFWIDSICINQYDVQEKSKQIGLMEKIYVAAAKVQIYLGERCDDASAADAMYALNPWLGQDKTRTYLSEHERARRAVRGLFMKPYFSRVWVIQEMTLAKATEIHWGNFSTPWHKLTPERIQILDDVGVGDAIPLWIRNWQGRTRYKLTKDISHLLWITMSSKASDPRDKIFGLFGLLVDAESEGLVPDYSLTVEQVYTRMASYLITKQNALVDVLRHAHCHRTLQGIELPSWVPDFRKPIDRVVPSLVNESSLQVRATSDGAILAEPSAGKLLLDGHRLDGVQKFGLSHRTLKFFRGPHMVVVPGISRWYIVESLEDAFDEHDTIFRLCNGHILHLRIAEKGKKQHILIGDCALRGFDGLPPLEVYDRSESFADALFPLKMDEFETLWAFYNNLQNIFQHEMYLGRNYLGRLELMSEWQDAPSAFETYRHFHLICATKNTIYQTHSNDESHELRTQFEQISKFQSFWEDQRTWRFLANLEDALAHVHRYELQTIGGLFQKWCRKYQAVEEAAQQFMEMKNVSRAVYAVALDKSHATVQELQRRIDMWEAATNDISEALGWRENHTWPFEKLPDGYIRDINGTGLGAPPYESEPCAVTERLFRDMREWVDSPESIYSFSSILKNWQKDWEQTFTSLRYLPTLKGKLNFDGLAPLRDGCLKRGAWRKTKMVIHPLERITIV